MRLNWTSRTELGYDRSPGVRGIILSPQSFITIPLNFVSKFILMVILCIIPKVSSGLWCVFGWIRSYFFSPQILGTKPAVSFFNMQWLEKGQEPLYCTWIGNNREEDFNGGEATPVRKRRGGDNKGKKESKTKQKLWKDWKQRKMTEMEENGDNAKMKEERRERDSRDH